MKTVVITGSSRGIGFGLAKAFLDRDCAVVISGRSEESTQTALDQFLGKYDSNRVIGIPCNVRYFNKLQA